MMGPQDVGGRAGFGPVDPKADEPLFHAPWERRALGLTLSCGALGQWTLDESRYARESLPAAVYYSSSYYAIWIRALENLLKRKGLLAEDEMNEERALSAGSGAAKKLEPGAVAGVLRRGAPVDRPPSGSPCFAKGQGVRTVKNLRHGHTRLPGYARDKLGEIVAVRGFHVFPDASAQGRDEGGWLYTVRFDGAELWGDGAEPGTVVHIDAWEAYLEPR